MYLPNYERDNPGFMKEQSLRDARENIRISLIIAIISFVLAVVDIFSYSSSSGNRSSFIVHLLFAGLFLAAYQGGKYLFSDSQEQNGIFNHLFTLLMLVFGLALTYVEQFFIHGVVTPYVLVTVLATNITCHKPIHVYLYQGFSALLVIAIVFPHPEVLNNVLYDIPVVFGVALLIYFTSRKMRIEEHERRMNLQDKSEEVLMINYKVEQSAEALTGASQVFINKANSVIQYNAQLLENINFTLSQNESQKDIVESMGKNIDQFSKELTRNIDEAKVVSEKSASSSQDSQEGLESISQINRQMNDINESVNLSMQTIHRLYDESNQINSIVSTISEIASQTNLLALNAAIEAARAGDAGRGFAVVADEVRKLAENVSNSIDEVSHVIKRIQTSVNSVVTTMQETDQKVKSSVELTHSAGKTIDTMASSIVYMGENIGNIVESSQKSLTHIQTMEQNIHHIIEETEQSYQYALKNKKSTEDTLYSIADIIKSAGEVEKMSLTLKEILL